MLPPFAFWSQNKCAKRVIISVSLEKNRKHENVMAAASQVAQAASKYEGRAPAKSYAFLAQLPTDNRTFPPLAL
jgi:hypothetical protein